MPASQPQPSYFYKLIVQHPGGEDKEFFGTQLQTDCGSAITQPTQQHPHLNTIQTSLIATLIDIRVRCCPVASDSRASSDPPVHFIPLGDSKQLSRRHFSLSYLNGHWHCVIKGKNAVLIGATPHRREQLQSGEDGPELQLRLPDDRVTPMRIGDVRMW